MPVNWLTRLFDKGDAGSRLQMVSIRDHRGREVCKAWKADYWSISYLLWAEPKGEA